MTPTDRERMEAIESRAKAATEGPWCWESAGEKSNEFVVGCGYGADGKPLSGCINGTGEWVEEAVIARHFIGANESGHAHFADGDFIAHAREDVPWLLARLTRALAVVEACRNFVEYEGDESYALAKKALADFDAGATKTPPGQEGERGQ